MEIRIDFGLRVRELRARSGMSQELLATRAGLDRSYIGGVERGERNVSLQNIARIAAGLDVPLSYLFSEERFSTNPAYMKKHFEAPFSERFVYESDYEHNIVAWRIAGIISGEEAERMTSILLHECSKMEGKVNFFVDHRDMKVDGEPVAYSPAVVGKAEEMHHKLAPIANQFVVLCNSKFMASQLDTVTKRRGIYDKASHLFDEDEEMVRKAYQLLDIRAHNLVAAKFKPVTRPG